MIGLYDANPVLYTGAIAEHLVQGARGFPYADPNNGFTTQALGYRAALDWLHGIVPWWNYYSGVGLPLAAEYQPAAFFPGTLVLLLPNGMLLQHVLLQVVAGLGTYGLLRQLGLGRFAATCGGLLFAFDGALAWFAHAPAQPVPFLPWMLWGVERALAATASGVRGGWRMLAVSLALDLLAGFPETAYLNGLLVLTWSLLRLFQARNRRLAVISRLALAGAVGSALAAPQILAFFQFLPHAYLGAHNGSFAHFALPAPALLSTLFFPYFYGPIAAYVSDWQDLGPIWGAMGGYASLITIVVALCGAMMRRTALTWLLLIWVLAVLAKTFGVPIITPLWNMVPGVGQAAFARYIVPTWEFALVVLAALAIEHLFELSAHSRQPRTAILIVSWVLLLAGLLYTVYLWPHVHGSPPLRRWAVAAAVWAVMTVAGFTLALVRCSPKQAAKIIATILVADSVAMFFIPTLANPRSGSIDTNAIRFLQKNLGLQRLFSLGPLQANYGAYFGIAAINHNYLPVSQRWVDWVRGNLDAYSDPIVFNGSFPRGPGAPTQSQELVRNIARYEWIGVKYVVASNGDDPFLSAISSKIDTSSTRPLTIKAGDTATGTLPVGLIGRPVAISHVGVSIGTYANKSDGVLRLDVCAGFLCSSGQRSVKDATDNSTFYVPLGHDLQLEKDAAVTYRLSYAGGQVPLVLWMSPTVAPASDQQLNGPAGPLTGFGLRLRLRLRDRSAPLAKQVYADPTIAIYELANPDAYFSDPSNQCHLSAPDREHVTAECARPSLLVRRELFFPGWTVSVNDTPASIKEYEGLLQSVEVPAGKSTLTFRYEPPHMVWAWLALALGAMVLVAPTWRRPATV